MDQNNEQKVQKPESKWKIFFRAVLKWIGLWLLTYIWRYAVALFDGERMNNAVIVFSYIFLAGILVCAMEVGYSMIRKMIEVVKIDDKPLFNFWIVLRAIGAEIFCVGYYCVAKACTFQMFGRFNYFAKNADTGKLEWVERRLVSTIEGYGNGVELQRGLGDIVVALIAIWVFSFIMRHSIDRFQKPKWYIIAIDGAICLVLPTVLSLFLPPVVAISICLAIDAIIGGIQLFRYAIKIDGTIGTFVAVRNYIYIAACAVVTVPLSFITGSWPNRYKTVLLNGLIGLPASLIITAIIIFTSKSFIVVYKQYKERMDELHDALKAQKEAEKAKKAQK